MKTCELCGKDYITDMCNECEQNKIITREQYMNGTYTHDEYYGQIAEALGLSYNPTDCKILAELLAQDEMKRDSDPHLNSIALHRWDNMGLGLERLANYKNVLKERNEDNTPAVRVCIIKSAMRKALANY